MNLRDLKYLVAIVEHEHFGKAADHCFVSQPTLSMQIKKLEDTLGVTLFERKNRSFMVTEIGQLIAEKAREILYHVDAMKDLAHQSKDPYCGELRIGVIPSLAPYLLPHIVSDLMNLFPNLKIYWTEKKTNELMKALDQGLLDGALLALPLAEKNLIVEPLFQEEFLLGVSKSHRFSTQKTIEPEALLDEESLLLLEEGHCLREQALAFCTQIKTPQTKKFEATSLETLRYMVASGLGVTFIPTLASKQEDGIHYLRFKGTRPSRIIGLISRSSTGKRQLLRDFASKIKASLDEKAKKIRIKILADSKSLRRLT